MAPSYHVKYTKNPPYLIVKTDTFSRGEVVLANQIFDSVNLLYNLGLLKNSLIYMKENLGIGYYAIFSSWNRLMQNKKMHKHNISSLITVFITKLLAQHKISLAEHVGLFKLVKKDLSYYYARHHAKNSNVLLQRSS